MTRHLLIGVLVLTASWPTLIRAQGKPHHPSPREEKAGAGDLVTLVREVTERFKDVSVAEAEGYSLMFGCVSGTPRARSRTGTQRCRATRSPRRIDDLLAADQKSNCTPILAKRAERLVCGVSQLA